MSLFRHELKSELLLYVRSRELAFFTFLFPIILFVLLGSSYGNDRIKSEGNVRGANFLEAGMIGYGAISIAFAGHEIWMYPGSLAMIAAWGVLGVALAIRGFRWEPVEAS